MRHSQSTGVADGRAASRGAGGLLNSLLPSRGLFRVQVLTLPHEAPHHLLLAAL